MKWPWSKRTPPKHPQEIRVPRVKFVGEQDGPIERRFKELLIDFFKRDRSVLVAYLAQIEVGGQMGVALCLRTQFGPDRGMAEKIGAFFKAIFNAQVHLDIMFPNAAQESELKTVCRPSFIAAGSEAVSNPPAAELFGAEALNYAKAHLHEVRVSAAGWETEYEDPRTGEKWLLDYPNSEQHGGGEPRLRKVG